MTIYFDHGTVIVAVISAVVSVSATWYFSKRYYTRESHPRPMTDNDLQAQADRQVFWFGVVAVLAFVSLFALIIITSTFRN